MRLSRGLFTCSIGSFNQFPGNLSWLSCIPLQGHFEKNGCGRFRGCRRGGEDDFMLRKEPNGFGNNDPDDTIEKGRPSDLWWYWL